MLGRNRKYPAACRFPFGEAQNYLTVFPFHAMFMVQIAIESKKCVNRLLLLKN